MNSSDPKKKKKKVIAVFSMNVSEPHLAAAIFSRGGAVPDPLKAGLKPAQIYFFSSKWDKRQT